MNAIARGMPRTILRLRKVQICNKKKIQKQKNKIKTKQKTQLRTSFKTNNIPWKTNDFCQERYSIY